MRAADLLFASPKLAFRFGLVAVFCVAFIPYSGVRAFEFVLWDDNVYVIDRPEIHGGLTSDGIKWSFTTFDNANWHPLTWLSYMLEIELFGLDSGVMHLTNLGLHCLNTVLVACVLNSLTGSHGLSLAIAMLFGVHPQHVEAVAWVSERKELLGIFFGLQSMLVWQWSRMSGNLRHRALAYLLFVLSLLSKQMLITLPFLLVVLDIFPMRTEDNNIHWKRLVPAVRSVWCYFLLSLGFTVTVFAAQRSGGAIMSTEALPIRYRLANAVQSLILYVAQTFVPLKLSPFYRHSLQDISVGLTLLCCAALLAAGVWIWKNRTHPGILAGSLWFLGTLVPVLGIVQLGAASRADRYMYFPHVGLFLLFGSLPVFQKRVGLIAVTSTLLSIATVSSILTWHQSQIWRDSISLWQACLHADPDNYRGHDQLALALLVDEQIEEALRESQVAMQYLENQSYGGTHTTLGCAQLFSGDMENAITNLKEAIRIRPDDHRALINLGYALHMSDLAESKRLFRQALKYSPMNVEAMGNLANCEAEEGNFSAAIELLKTAIKIDPDNPQLKENLRTFQEADRLNHSH
jgi:tetratricopeptide (TPR) repeat protein